MEELSIVKKNYINYINKIITNNHVSHAYLFEIDNYDNDYVYIINFIKMILCNIKYDEIDNSNNSIISLINNNNYPDIKIIEPGGSYIKKTQLLELQKDYSNKSLLDGKRIYIIKNAEKLNSSSANTMLKFLEEPEDNIIAFLITDNRYHVLDTIISRCQVINLKENNVNFIENDDIIELLDCIIKPENFFIKYNYFMNNIFESKDILKEKFLIIENILISYLNFKYLQESDYDSKIISILKGCSTEKILNILSILEEEIVKLEYNVNLKLWIDSLFSKFIIGG